MRRVMVSLIAHLCVCSRAYGITECKGVVQSYFTDTGAAQGASAKLWVVMPSGLQWYILQSDADSKNILVGVTTSMATGLPVVVRFQTDGVACDSSFGVRTDVLGMWLAGS
jgi:hypothetical protein